MSKIEKGHFHYNIPHPIAIVGDTHIPICRTDMLFNFLQYAIQCGVTHVLHAGDFVNRNPNLRNTLSIVKRMQERFPLAWHVAWGNHEAGVPLKTIEKCVHELACTQYADEWSGTVFGHNFKMQHHLHSSRSEHVLYISGHTHLSEQRQNFLNPGTFRARKNGDHGFPSDYGAYLLYPHGEVYRWGAPDKSMYELEGMLGKPSPLTCATETVGPTNDLYDDVLPVTQRILDRLSDKQSAVWRAHAHGTRDPQYVLCAPEKVLRELNSGEYQGVLGNAITLPTDAFLPGCAIWTTLSSSVNRGMVTSGQMQALLSTHRSAYQPSAWLAEHCVHVAYTALARDPEAAKKLQLV